MQYEWEEGYLVEETLRGVGPMKRGFHLFKKRARQPLFLMSWIMISLSIQTLCILCCLARVGGGIPM